MLAVILSFAPRLARGSRIERVFKEGEHSTSQTTLRFSIVLLLFLLAVAAQFGLDVVLGAFLAGMVLRRWAPGDVHSLEEKLDAVGYGFFIPVFFVVSGMNLDVDSIVEAPLRLLVFFVLLLLVRGLPALLVYRRALSMTQRVQMMFITATTLPLLVALAEIGLRNGTMLPENAVCSGRRRRVVGDRLPGGRRRDRGPESRPRAGRAHLSGAAERADRSRPDRRARLSPRTSRACRTGGRGVTRRAAGPAATRRWGRRPT